MPPNLTYDGPVEDMRGVKGWLEDQMTGSTIYKETSHQPTMTDLIDPELARGRSRSFQRLEHALQELLAGEARVTPQRLS